VEFQTELFDRYQRSEKVFVLALIQMYVRGVSTRKVSVITEAQCGL
jgi:transposase-like protein